MINTVNMAGTYTIVVDNKLEIVSVTHNGQLMTKSKHTGKKFKPQHFEKVPGSDDVIVPIELDSGCVGFGALSEDPTGKDPCRWLWGTWW